MSDTSEGQEQMNEAMLAAVDTDPFEEAEQAADDAAAESAAAEVPAGDPPPEQTTRPTKVPDHDGFSYDQATKAAESLRKASRGCPVRQVRYVLDRWAREWEHAAAGVEGEDELTIECIGSCTPGMQVPVSREWRGDQITERGTIIRVMVRDGQHSLHVEVPSDPKPVYENYAHPGSPVVVFR